MRRAGVVATAVALALVLTGCGDGDAPEAGADGRVSVVASFYPIAEAASRIGGDRVSVTNLVPPGVEPHDFELTTREIDKLEGADVVLYVGNGFQPAIDDVAERLNGAVNVTAGIEFEGDDPHFWLDPVRLITVVDAIERALSKESAPDAEGFRERSATYKAELTALDEELRAGLETCQRREIVTAHDAFGYLAERYGLTQLAISGLTPEAEPTPTRMADLASQVRRHKVTTIFYETLVSPKVAETLARETGVQTAVLDPMEGLDDEALAAGKDYAAVMRDNLATLRGALGCT